MLFNEKAVAVVSLSALGCLPVFAKYAGEKTVLSEAFLPNSEIVSNILLSADSASASFPNRQICKSVNDIILPS